MNNITDERKEMNNNEEQRENSLKLVWPGYTWTFDHEGEQFRAEASYDDSANYIKPWEDSDCHGVVEDEPIEGRTVPVGDSGYHYDMLASFEKAKEQQWGGDDTTAELDSIIREAVKADYEYLTRWATGDMSVISIKVTRICTCCGNSVVTDEPTTLYYCCDFTVADFEREARNLADDLLFTIVQKNDEKP